MCKTVFGICTCPDPDPYLDYGEDVFDPRKFCMNCDKEILDTVNSINTTVGREQRYAKVETAVIGR